MKKSTAPIVIAATFALACMAATAWGSPQATSGTKKSTSSTARKTTGTTAHRTRSTGASAPSLLRPASLKLQAPSVFDAKFVTTKGEFTIQVTRAWSPRGADRFYNLVKYHFFDGAAFFRVLPGFVAQFGISPRPDVSHAWENANINDDPVTQSNTRGTITFATAGPNTRTTQVFINLGENANLDKMGFSPFGRITTGMEVVDKLYGDYGEGQPNGSGPDQNRMQSEGKPYLEKSFPLLDTIKTTMIVPPAPAVKAPPAKSVK